MSQPNPSATSFRILEAEGADRLEWLSLFDSWPRREVFAHPDYLSLYENVGSRAVCAVYATPEGRVIYPLILRDLEAAGFPSEDGARWHDTTSAPYGYGGPFVDGGGEPENLTRAFFEEYDRWAVSQNIVSEYITLSPKQDPRRLHYPGEVAVKMPTVVRSLDLSPDELFRDYKKTLQRHVKGALRAGVTVEIDLTGERTAEFVEIHEQTLHRRSAEARYSLDALALDKLNRNLRGQFAYFYAHLDGQAVSTELVLCSADSTFFFRGGTLEKAFPAKPNHLLKHHIILWSMKEGMESYILGGGNAGEDELYRYKLAFAPGGARPLRVGCRIFNHPRYDELVTARRTQESTRGIDWVPRPGYFPTYRAPSGS